MLHRGLFRAIAPSATNIRFKSSRVDVPPIWEEIPLIGLGTAAFEDTGSSLVQAVECALVAGVRLFENSKHIILLYLFFFFARRSCAADALVQIAQRRRGSRGGERAAVSAESAVALA